MIKRIPLKGDVIIYNSGLPQEKDVRYHVCGYAGGDKEFKSRIIRILDIDTYDIEDQERKAKDNCGIMPDSTTILARFADGQYNFMLRFP